MIFGTRDGFDGDQAPAPWFVDVVRKFSGDKLTLDFGSGHGRYTQYANHAHGYEPGEGEATYKNESDIPSSYYQRIMCIEVIEHVLDVSEFFRTINRVAAPYAELLITTPNIGWWKHRLRALAGKPPAGEPPDNTPHIRHFTWDTLRACLMAHGWHLMPPHVSDLTRGTWAGFPGGSFLLKAGADPALLSAGIIMHAFRPNGGEG